MARDIATSVVLDPMAGGAVVPDTCLLFERKCQAFDYQRLLTNTGWKIIRRIECPLSTERLTGNMVQNMQNKRILGTIGRTLLIAKKS